MQKNNSIQKIALSSLLLSLFAFSSSSSFAKEYYKWVDSKGSTHYTTTPPPKNAKNHGKVNTYGQTSYTQYTAPSTAQNNSTATPAPQSTPAPVQPQQSSNANQQKEMPRTEAPRPEPVRMTDAK